MNFILIIAAGVIASIAFGSENKTPETKPPGKRQKYSRTFIVTAGKWLKENKVPEDWDGSKLEYALEEMPFEGEVYE